MWELVLGIQKSQVRDVPAPLAVWRRELDHRLGRTDRGRHAVSLLRCLVTAVGSFPDFLTPPGPVTSLDVGCEGVACTPRSLLETDLPAVFAGRASPPWVRSLAGGDREVMSEVVRAIRSSYELLLARHWTEVHEVATTDRATRTRQLRRPGAGRPARGSRLGRAGAAHPLSR